jgi:hypothetical protein
VVLRALFDEMKGEATRFPTDEEVIERLAERKLYGSLPTSRLRYVLQAIEERKRTRFDETVIATDNATIEHVMPQRWAEKWPLPDGSKAPCESALEALISHDVTPEQRDKIATRERLVDSIGNLTLVTSSLNPSLGNESFAEKKAKLSKLTCSTTTIHPCPTAPTPRTMPMRRAGCSPSCWPQNTEASHGQKRTQHGLRDRVARLPHSSGLSAQLAWRSFPSFRRAF